MSHHLGDGVLVLLGKHRQSSHLFLLELLDYLLLVGLWRLGNDLLPMQLALLLLRLRCIVELTPDFLFLQLVEQQTKICT